MDDDPSMPVIDDPDWARRVAAIEKEFRQAERRRRVSRRAPRAPRRRQFRAVHLWIGIAVVIVAYAVIVKPWGTDGPGNNDPSLGLADANVSSPSTGQVPSAGGQPTTADPFAGTPAQTWLSADRGVIMPPAAKSGPFSKVQVAPALDLAHRYILLTRADPRVVINHQVTLLTALVVPEELRRPGLKITGADSILRPTLLAPGNRLAAPIRVNGTVTYTYQHDAAGHPILQVTTNLVWAYPLVPYAGVPTPGDTISLRHDHMTLNLYPTDTKLRDKVFIEDIEGFQSNLDCEYADQGLMGLPRVDDPSRAPVPSATLPTDDRAYDPRTPVDGSGNCL
ncbi:hypothetical protein ABIB25_001139 [Nakamurella sp. UYEF19]|uniref:hypothetical protein n=1 Tax=Nakamurella sp. UYEF19 TaxID=1756392 RepID=UPI00339A6A79